MMEEESLGGGAPHEALFMVLPYLASLWELLAMSQVCVSLRDAVFREDNLLPWVELVVQNPPISRRLCDDKLVRITNKAKGRLRTLALFDCFNITDHALLLVIRNNPLIRKLYIPGCTNLTPEGVINAVRILSSSSSNNLKLSLKISGIYNLSKEHLQTLHSYLFQIVIYKHHRPTHKFLHQNQQLIKTNTIDDENNSSIDVEVCPRCDQVRMVFSCPKLESCRNSMRMEDGCRGCVICIPRCVECGACLDADDEDEEIGVCGDVLCLGCWLQLPKCNLCNRPYCSQHYSSNHLISNSNEGFVCASCTLDDALTLMGGSGDTDY